MLNDRPNRSENNPDPVPYGVAANRATLETSIRFCVEQGIVRTAPLVEEICAPSTLALA